MGGSRVVLVGATSLIVGIYSLSVKKVETGYVTTAFNRAKAMQAERVAEASLRLAVNDLATRRGSWRKVATRNLLGGSTQYQVSKKGRYANISVTVDFGGVKRTAVASVYRTDNRLQQGFKKIHRGRWEVVGVYTKPI